MEAELKSSHPGLNVKLKKGSGGIFDITQNGKLIYSKAEENRFPRKGEITGLIPK